MYREMVNSSLTRIFDSDSKRVYRRRRFAFHPAGQVVSLACLAPRLQPDCSLPAWHRCLPGITARLSGVLI